VMSMATVCSWPPLNHRSHSGGEKVSDSSVDGSYAPRADQLDVNTEPSDYI